jgi:aminomethyltransferase
MTLEDNPYEVGLGWLVALEKPSDFVGKEALKRIQVEGIKRQLVGVEIGGEPIEFNPTKWHVSRGGQNIGYITSAIYSPRLKKNIGYATVPIEQAALGTRLTVAIPEAGERLATVVPKPFLDPQKDIPKG